VTRHRRLIKAARYDNKSALSRLSTDRSERLCHLARAPVGTHRY